MSSYAFTSAAGYTQLQGTAWSPQIFSKKVQKVFRKKTVVNSITNSDYFGEIKNLGDSVRIIKEPEITVKRLYRGTQVVSQDLEDKDFVLTVDRGLYYTFSVDDIEKQQSHVNWMDMAADRASYQMTEEYDADILGYMSGYERDINTGVWSARSTAIGTKAWDSADADELLSGNKLTRGSFVSSGGSNAIIMGVDGTYDATPLRILNRMNRLLNALNVPHEGRFVVVDPVFEEMLMDESSKLVNNDYNANQNAGGQLENGQLIAGKLRGFKVYGSNSLPSLGGGPATIDTDGTNTTDFGVIVAGHMDAVATAEQLTRTETYRAQDRFADITRGMQVYGRKILRPEALVRAIYNVNK